MDINQLTDGELAQRIEILRGKERALVLKFLIHLGEFDKRKLYLDLGYSSLFDYCVRKLGYSESGAYRRILSARFLRDNPRLNDNFLKGELSICSIAIASNAVQAKKAVIKEIIGKSAREVKALVNEVLPMEKPREVIKEIKVVNKAAEVTGDLFKVKSNLPVSNEPARETRYEIKFSVTKEVYEEIQSIKSKLSNKLGADLSLEGVFTEIVKSFQADARTRKANPTKPTPSKQSSRYIPTPVKREVLKRDNYQCSYISPEGIRCNQKHYLNIDHIKPFALGGSSSSDNLRVLCSAHNQLVARRVFGEWPGRSNREVKAKLLPTGVCPKSPSFISSKK